MKKTLIFSLIAGMSSLFAKEPFAKDPSLVLSGEDLPEETKSSLVERMVERSKSFVYLKMSGADSQPTDSIKVLPGLGLGYRLNAGTSAIDFSVSSIWGRRTDGRRSYFYTVPKATYIRYFAPARNQSPYAGVGLAWGGLRTKDDREFEGIIPNATVGVEMNRNANWRSFVQLDVSQPAIAAKTKGDFPGPMAELSIGAGF